MSKIQLIVVCINGTANQKPGNDERTFINRNPAGISQKRGLSRKSKVFTVLIQIKISALMG